MTIKFEKIIYFQLNINIPSKFSIQQVISNILINMLKIGQTISFSYWYITKPKIHVFLKYDI